MAFLCFDCKNGVENPIIAQDNWKIGDIIDCEAPLCLNCYRQRMSNLIMTEVNSFRISSC